MNDSKSEIGDGSHVQLFVYRIPKRNHDAIKRVQSQLADIYKKHGILRSEFFKLSSNETFMGNTSIASIVSASQDEEVWLELEYYRDLKHSDDMVAKVEKDSGAGPLFGEMMGLVAQGSSNVQGDFSRLRM